MSSFGVWEGGEGKQFSASHGMETIYIYTHTHTYIHIYIIKYICVYIYIFYHLDHINILHIKKLVNKNINKKANMKRIHTRYILHDSMHLIFSKTYEAVQ